uniref:SGNH/GDSL hydrolase family protein n=1 Tax=Acidobacterium capsulatum TaxID=33075 RepID=A0A7V4XQL0_9BACT
MLVAMKCFLLLLLAAAVSASAQTASSLPPGTHWVGSWASSQQIPEPRNTLPAADLTDATVRQIVHLSLGGDELRIRLSNAWGVRPLTFTAVHIAEPVALDSSAIVPATDAAVTFGGHASVTIPAGAEYVSDPVHFDAKPLSSLAITFYLKQPPARETSHPGARATTYYVHGEQVSAPELKDAGTVDHWFEISGVDVAAPRKDACIIALGDSITDGHATEDNKNQRWTDDLAARLQAHRQTRNLCVLNEGIGGNRLLQYGLGPAAAARVDRDVLAQAGARTVILLEGVNDIGVFGFHKNATPADHHALVERMIEADRQIIERAHEHGLRILGGTIMPFEGSGYYHPGPQEEADLAAVNAWIRTPGHFDGVIDFNKIMRDPAHPLRLNPKYDSGDHLHPGPAGYEVMANSIPLKMLLAK